MELRTRKKYAKVRKKKFFFSAARTTPTNIRRKVGDQEISAHKAGRLRGQTRCWPDGEQSKRPARIFTLKSRWYITGVGERVRDERQIGRCLRWANAAN